MIQSELDESTAIARTVFAGLTPSARPAAAERVSHPTLPILLAGTMAVAMTTGAITVVHTPPKPPVKPDAGQGDSPETRTTVASISRSATPAPATYRVVKGDTVSGIAGRYGISTKTVLSLNGLSASSLIFPGQVLKLTSAATPAPAVTTPATSTPIASSSSTKYTIVKGDTISKVAKKYGVSTQSVLTANGLSSTSIIYPGQVVTIPTSATSAPAPVATTPPAPVLDAQPISSVTPTPAAPAPAAPAPSTPTTPAPVNGSYTIRSGDTITSIASRFGVTVQAVLTANGLTRTSIIYAGRTLVIPGVATTTTTAGATSGITLLSEEQERNAAVIISVGRELGVSDYGIIIALATAMQESSLRNISYGHLDSVGLFQQRPSSGWGTVAQLTDAAHAARLFYGGASNPNKGKTRGLLDISGWQSMTLTQAAQKVQISAYPDAYAKWEASARVWFSELG